MVQAGNSHGITADQLQEVREAFDLFDVDGSGSIDVRELKIAMRALGFDVKKREVVGLVREMGKDEGSTVDYGEFLHLMSAKMATRESRGEVAKVRREVPRIHKKPSTASPRPLNPKPETLRPEPWNLEG
jgi:centrin-1